MRLMMFLCAIAVLGCSCDSSSSTRAPNDEWPRSTPEQQGVDSAALAAVIERIDRDDLDVDSVQIVRNGVLVLDAYFYPYLGEQPHDVASVTKSVTSTLVGIAIDRGLLALDTPVWDFFQDVLDAPVSGAKADITLEHLLSMTSGLDCGRSPGEPELYAMIASDNFVQHALALPSVTTPGQEFSYCSPGSHLMSAMVRKAAAEATTLEFATTALFDRIGIDEVVWPEDPQGVHHGWGDLQLHPHDMARIGLLFLNEGRWNDVQVVSEAWVEEATTPVVLAAGDGTGYGYQWWILAGDFEGVYEARGRGGQAIIVWPEADVVAVFTGRGIDARGELAPLLASAVSSEDTLEANPDGLMRLIAALDAARKAPPAQPIPELPDFAAEVSGQRYRLEANQFDVKCIALRFDSPADVFFELTVGEGTFELPVGMDGVPRFSESGPTGIPVGVTGAWTGPRVFEMAYDEVAGPNHLRIAGTFSENADAASLIFTDPSEYFGPQIVPAEAVTDCD